MSDYAVLLEEIADREAEARAVMHRASGPFQSWAVTLVVVPWTGKDGCSCLNASWGMCCYRQSSLMKMTHVPPCHCFFFSFLSLQIFVKKGWERKNDVTVTELKGKLAFGA